MTCPCGSPTLHAACLNAHYSNLLSSVFGRDGVTLFAEVLLPSDHGLPDARPLPPDTWAPPIIEAPDWAEQNRKINDVLMGRANG